MLALLSNEHSLILFSVSLTGCNSLFNLFILCWCVCRVWQPEGAVLSSSCHTGFVMDVAWNPQLPGVLADCSWDGSMALYVM